LRGRDIKRYKAEFADLWLIATFPSLKINIDKYPAIKAFLEGFKPKLKQEGVSISDADRRRILEHAKRWNITVSEDNLKKSRKKTGNKWFETQDQISYYQEFEKEKIIYPNMTLFLPFIYDDIGYFINDKGFILSSNAISLKFLVGYFNSRLAHRWIRENCPELQGGTRELRKIFFENIPIPMLSESEQKPFVALVEKILAGKERGEDTTGLEREIDLMVYRLYGLSYEEVKVVDPEFWLSREEYERG